MCLARNFRAEYSRRRPFSRARRYYTFASFEGSSESPTVRGLLARRAERRRIRIAGSGYVHLGPGTCLGTLSSVEGTASYLSAGWHLPT